MANKTEKDSALATNVNFDLSSFATGMENLDERDVANQQWPYVKLLQSTSQEVAKSKGDIRAGQFLAGKEDEKQIFDSLHVSIINVAKPRSMWGPFKRGEAPLCRSFDGVKKADGGTGDGECKTCQFAQFKKGVMSPCKMSYEFLCYDIDNDTYFKLQAGGKSVSPARKYLQSIEQAWRKLKEDLKEKQQNHPLLQFQTPPLFCFETVIGSEMGENDSGIFSFLTFKDPEPNQAIFKTNDLNAQFSVMNEFSETIKSIQFSVREMNNMTQQSYQGIDSNISIVADDDDMPF